MARHHAPWERAALPSEVRQDALGNWIAVDGPDNAPASAHTYDNNIFLPIWDRFLVFGGAAFNNGGAYLREATPTTSRRTGPYLFDPSKADPNKVGGTNGVPCAASCASPGGRGRWDVAEPRHLRLTSRGIPPSRAATSMAPRRMPRRTARTSCTSPPGAAGAVRTESLPVRHQRSHQREPGHLGEGRDVLGRTHGHDRRRVRSRPQGFLRTET